MLLNSHIATSASRGEISASRTTRQGMPATLPVPDTRRVSRRALIDSLLTSCGQNAQPAPHRRRHPSAHRRPQRVLPRHQARPRPRGRPARRRRHLACPVPAARAARRGPLHQPAARRRGRRRLPHRHPHDRPDVGPRARLARRGPERPARGLDLAHARRPRGAPGQARRVPGAARARRRGNRAGPAPGRRPSAPGAGRGDRGAVSEPAARQHYGTTLGVLSLAALSYALLQTMVAPALPAIQHELGASTTAVTWVLTVYLLTASVATPILGRVGDMFGKERTLVGVLCLFAVGSLISALSHSIGLLIAGRAVQGAAGAVFPLAFGIIRDEFPPER